MGHLSGWQRLGIVASIVWIIGGGFFEAKTESDQYQRVFAMDYQTCSNYGSDQKNRVEEAQRDAEPWLSDRWLNIATFALGPVPFAWLAGWIASVGGADHD